MRKFELRISIEDTGYITYDEYVGGAIVVVCNGVNITKQENSTSKSVVGDHYFSVFGNWLKAIPRILTTNEEVICQTYDDPYNFTFKREGDNIAIGVYHRHATTEFNKKMGGGGEPIDVPLEDFIDEVLKKSDYFIKTMMKKNPEIGKNAEFKEIIEKRYLVIKAWEEYKSKKKDNKQ